ncbi:hypothetical protein AHF37_11377 [Paragonimus kellicotti]|nr:hypothetical protein AHF37_11377 [Paragonimus kellicotti]
MEDCNDGDLADGYANTVKQQELETAKLCEENSAYMIESLRSSSLHLDRLARLRTGQGRWLTDIFIYFHLLSG